MIHAIETQNLEHMFYNKKVLDNINLQVSAGEIFGLLGPSGAGKTTLIKILTGQLRQTSGTAKIQGRDTGQLYGRDYKQIGIMMDNFGLYERLTCYDNLKLFAKIYGIPKEGIMDSLKDVGLSAEVKTAVRNLSKGMQNRLLLARALMIHPSVLFLDEPTCGLDPATSESIHKLIWKEREKGVTIFLTTHNMTEAEVLCDNMGLLHNGIIVEYGNPKEICRKYNVQKKIRLHLYNGTEIEVSHDKSAAEILSRYLEQEMVETIHTTEPNLETVFMELTGRRLE